MLRLAQIRDWLKTLDLDVEYYYIGKLDNKKDKSIGVYPLKQSNTPNLALGGLSSTSYKTKAISILIHYNINQNATEIASNVLYEKLEEQTNIIIDNVEVDYIELLANEPQDVGTDEKGVYEMVIQAVFYYKR